MNEDSFDEDIEWRIRPRPSETVTVQLPKTALNSLEKVAEARDMSVEALIRFYIGQALREDWIKFFPNVVPETTKELLGSRSRLTEETASS